MGFFIHIFYYETGGHCLCDDILNKNAGLAAIPKQTLQKGYRLRPAGLKT